MPNRNEPATRPADEEVAVQRLARIAESAKVLGRAGLAPEVIAALLRESFPELSNAFGALSDGTKAELDKSYNALRKALGDCAPDLDTEAGRHELVTRCARDLELGTDDVGASAKFYETRPDARQWVGCAPATEPEPKAVQKAEPSVRDRIEKRFDDLARAHQRANPSSSYEQSYSKVMTSDEARDLYAIYSDPYSGLSGADFVRSLDVPREPAEGRAVELTRIYKRRLGAF